jgi:hypothetical protein
MWKVIRYEVWGNKKDGWEVNDLHTIATLDNPIGNGYTGWNSIRAELVELGIIPKRNRSIRPDDNTDNSETIYLVDYSVKNGGWKPVGEIRKVTCQ